MWGTNLDRFSRPLSSEVGMFQDGPIIYEIEKDVVCQGCGHVLYEEEDIVPSEIWEDDYIHNDLECIELYYKKEQEKDPFAANKRVG
ncbi:hypothetical protein F7731_23690 [Cytobacillus depressus]|uniref:Uncharacterized protein n=1 Tax=Cytobacillus depressus TaxID=1602942 RepID=A0A6L3V0H1_9BACI|nr:hypothetical protein [Cytobacillus depressus]KAB2328957.1 hypothetical protein F7731_23690 [Cytobacillus depressus]